MTAISADGATQTLYLRSIGSGIEYCFDNSSWITASSVPITITNINGNTTDNILKILFQTNFQITNLNQYFICGSAGLQFGNDITLNDGTLPLLTINSVSGFTGLIENGTSSTIGQNTVIIKNLEIQCRNGTTMSIYAGLFGSAYYANGARGCQIVNCIGTIDTIVSTGGGITGMYSAKDSGNLSISACKITVRNSIDIAGGGIVGANAAYNSGTMTVSQCYITGIIGTSAGGIFGSGAGTNGGTCIAVNCYSDGSIDINGGGIFGEYASAATSAINCYSLGQIGGAGGGIFGYGGAGTAQNCYSVGVIYNQAGGIFGLNYSGTAYNCYTIGISLSAGNGVIYSGTSSIAPSNYGEGSGTWNNTRSAQYLDGVPTPVNPVGNVWIQPNGLNTPYLFAGFGYSPYTTQLISLFSQTISAGNSSTPALLAGYTYSILAINTESPANYPGISIDSATGIITLDTTVVSDTYILTIFCQINPYRTTTFIISVPSPPVPPPTPTISTVQVCCPTASNLNFYSYHPYNEYAEGTVIANEQINNTRRKFGSYDLYLKFITGLAYKR